jgi:drug/metabolite transporter (DMT)-like permease
LNLFRISNFEIWYVCNGDHGAEFLVGSVDVNQRDNAPFNPSLALISGILAVSTGAIFARLAEAPALVIAAYRVGLASLILAPIAWWQVRDELLGLEKKEYLLAGLAGLFLACHFGTWISSLNYTSVANSVVLVNTNPIWVGVLTPLISKDRLSWMTRIGIVISVIGGVIIGFGDFAIGRQALWGDFLALLGSVCAAMYLLLGRNLRQKLSLLAYIVLCYGSAAIILWGDLLGICRHGRDLANHWPQQLQLGAQMVQCQPHRRKSSW